MGVFFGYVNIPILVVFCIVYIFFFYKHFLISILITARYVVTDIVNNTFFFGFVFRSQDCIAIVRVLFISNVIAIGIVTVLFRVLIVLYSDRGLVVAGELKLNLLHQLYW